MHSCCKDLVCSPTDNTSMQMSEDRKKQILDRSFGAIQHWLPRFNVMIIGPGLGRDEMVHDTIKQVSPSSSIFQRCM